MALNPANLASEIQKALGMSGAPSKELIGEATAICDEVLKALVSFAPGAIVGVAPPTGGPLTLGAGTGGTISGMTGSSLANDMKTQMNKPKISKQLQAVADAIVSHTMTGLVEFAPNMILAACSNTATSPGAVTGLISTGGQISGLSGQPLSALMAEAFGGKVSPQLLKMCDAITNHIMSNSITGFVAAQVVGTASAGGGPIAAGAGVGGTIT